MDNKPKNKSDLVLPIMLFGFLALIALFALDNIFRDKKIVSENKLTPTEQGSAQSNQNQQTQIPTESGHASDTQVTVTDTPVKYYTMADVQAHGALGDSEECWTVIHGKVYDIAEFAATAHPGGELIYQACGIDATKLFETRPMGSGTPHSDNARKILEKYYIGDLKK